jgi:Protein of unknown function (DUF3887)
MSGELQPKRKIPVWQKLLIAGAVFLGVVMFGVFSQIFLEFRDANRAFNGFTDALIAKNYAGAYQYTAPEFRAATDYDAFVRIHRGLIDRMGDLKSVEASQGETNEHHDGWYGTVNADLTFAKGDLQFSFTLRKESGVWKVYSYHEL